MNLMQVTNAMALSHQTAVPTGCSAETVLLKHHFLPCGSTNEADVIKQCQQGLPKKLKRLLKQLSEDAKVRNSSVVFEAVRSCRNDILRHLVENGARLDGGDAEGNTPLHLALATDQNVMVSILLHFGASTNTANNDGQTPLHVACERKLVEVSKKLLAYGADVNALNKEDRNALTVAVRVGSAPLVTMLLKSGANPRVKDAYGWEAWDYASLCNHVDIMRILSDYSAKGLDMLASETVSVSTKDCVSNFSEADSVQPFLSISSPQIVGNESNAAAPNLQNPHLVHRMSSRFQQTSVLWLGHGPTPIGRSCSNAASFSDLSQNFSTVRSMNFSVAKTLLNQELGKIENEMKWRRALLREYVKVEKELHLTEQRISREMKEKESLEQTASQLDSRVSKLQQSIADLQEQNQKLKFQHQASLSAETARLNKNSENRRMESEYRQLMGDIVVHNEAVKYVASSVTSYLTRDDHGCLETAELLAKPAMQCRKSKFLCMVKLDESLTNLCCSLWWMAAGIKSAQRLLVHQRAKNALLTETLGRMTSSSEDVGTQYEKTLKAFYEGKSHQDVLDKSSQELDVGIKECFALVDAMLLF